MEGNFYSPLFSLGVLQTLLSHRLLSLARFCSFLLKVFLSLIFCLSSFYLSMSFHLASFASFLITLGVLYERVSEMSFTSFHHHPSI